MRSKAFLVTLLAFVTPVSVIADQHVAEVQAWLEKMHRAAHTLNYEGIFVYGQNNKLSSMRIIHSATKTGERERLISMDGTGRQVIRDGDYVTCILPDSKSVVVEKSRPKSQFPPAFPMKVDKLINYYDLSLASKGKVAGHTTQKIAFKPKDNLRYGHTLWVDEKTGLLLKTHLLDERGRPIEQFMFTQINFLKTVPEKLLKSTISREDYTWYEAKQNNNNAQVMTKKPKMRWRVKRLPQGFKQDMERKHKMSTSVMPVEHLVFSDGMASISVFIEKNISEKGNLVGDSRMGAVNAHGRTINNHHVTVVGEVPHAAVKMIGESVEYVKQ